jgi:hypothetical protein
MVNQRKRGRPPRRKRPTPPRPIVRFQSPDRGGVETGPDLAPETGQAIRVAMLYSLRFRTWGIQTGYQSRQVFFVAEGAI